MNGSSGCGFASAMVSQGPAYDRCEKKKRKCNRNQVISKKTGLIRPDKRYKVKFL